MSEMVSPPRVPEDPEQRRVWRALEELAGTVETRNWYWRPIHVARAAGMTKQELERVIPEMIADEWVVRKRAYKSIGWLLRPVWAEERQQRLEEKIRRAGYTQVFRQFMPGARFATRTELRVPVEDLSRLLIHLTEVEAGVRDRVPRYPV